MKIFLTNTLSGKKEEFIPIDQNNIKMYVCGPTVYDKPHIGNVRSSVIFDILYRLLSTLYTKVTYVRNITDVDDKIITRATEKNESPQSLTSKMTKYFHEDLRDLNCLIPTYEPRATENIAKMIEMIAKLIRKGHAYVKHGHVYFDVNSCHKYGKLSKRTLENQNPGARIKISKFKQNPLDFVLWKPKKDYETIFFASPWGYGRPGWHIECSVMSKQYLGDEFDIHGGGIDLVFPHHENEIAQSICESEHNKCAVYWIHNGFLTVNNNKMSKNLKNIITVKELLDKGIDSTAIRYFYLTSNYKKPLDFNEKALEDAKKSVEKFTKCFQNSNIEFKDNNHKIPKQILSYLADDLNTPLSLSYLHHLSNKILDGQREYMIDFLNSCNILGLNIKEKSNKLNISNEVIKLAEKRKRSQANKNWQEADNIRVQIRKLGYQIVDTKSRYKIKLL